LWRELRGFRAHRFVVRSCFAGPGSSVLLSGSEDGLVHAWAVRTPHTSPSPFAPESHEHAPPDPALLGRLRGHTATINALASTQLPNGAYVFASAADDYTIRLWRLHTKRGHGAGSDLDEE
jgi:WD40 repeat protein